ncbi:MAG: segregation/condensation protein A [Bacillota bacterium]
MEFVPSGAYSFKLEAFEGPLDLLFHLLEKNKINLYDIPIAQLTDQYMEYLFAMQELDLELASEFLVMAATLLHIKSRMLLPDKKLPTEGEEMDPREELVLRLIEYKKYKQAAVVFAAREREWSKLYFKLPELFQWEKRIIIEELSPIKLAITYNEVLKRNIAKMDKTVQKGIETIIATEKVTLRSKIRQVVRTLMEKAYFKFSELFSVKTQSRAEVVTGFMAVLELAKVRKVKLKQDGIYKEITVSRVEGSMNNGE